MSPPTSVHNESHSRFPSLEYVPHSPSPNTPSFPVLLTVRTDIPLSGLNTLQIMHTPLPQLAAASPLPASPPLQIPPQAPSTDLYHASATQPSQLAAEIAAKTHLNAALHMAHTPISPQSVAYILQGHANIPTGNLHGIIMGLISAINAHNDAHHLQVHDLKDQVAGLIQKHYLQPIDLDDIPSNFVENNGHVLQFLIPIHDDLELPTTYICPLHTLNYTKAAGITGKLGPDEQEYIKEIFTTPGDTSLPVQPTPTWFLHTIQAGSKRTYKDLHAKAIAFNNWGIITNLHCYHEDDEKLAYLNHLHKQLVLKCNGLHETKALALVRLESAHVPLCLSHAHLLYTNSTSPLHSPCGMSLYMGCSDY